MKKLDSSKIILSLCALGIVLSIGYYFVLYLPGVQNAKIAKEEAEKLYQRRENCVKQSQDYYERLKKEVDQGIIILYPTYHYNPDLEKCFYSGSTLQGNVVSKYIVDINENQTVAMYLSEVDGKALNNNFCSKCMELEDFKAKEKELLEK